MDNLNPAIKRQADEVEAGPKTPPPSKRALTPHPANKRRTKEATDQKKDEEDKEGVKVEDSDDENKPIREARHFAIQFDDDFHIVEARPTPLLLEGHDDDFLGVPVAPTVAQCVPVTPAIRVAHRVDAAPILPVAPVLPVAHHFHVARGTDYLLRRAPRAPDAPATGAANAAVAQAVLPPPGNNNIAAIGTSSKAVKNETVLSFRSKGTKLTIKGKPAGLTVSQEEGRTLSIFEF